MRIIFKLCVFIFMLASIATNASMKITNGSDFAIIYALNYYCNDDAFLKEKIKSVPQMELDILSLYNELRGLGVCCDLITSGINNVIMNLNPNELLVLAQKPALPQNMPTILIVKKNHANKLKLLSFLDEKAIDTTCDELFEYFNSKCLNQAIILKGLTSQEQKIDDEILHNKIKPSSAITNISLTGYIFKKDVEGDMLKIPTLVDLGEIPSTGGKIALKIPIKNIGRKNLILKHMITECQCVKNLEYPSLIQPGESSYITFLIDPDYYKGNTILENTIRLISSDPKRKDVSIKIIGILSEQNNLLIEPFSLFSIIKDHSLKYKHNIKIFVFNPNKKEDFNVSYNLEYDHNLFSKKISSFDRTQIGKYVQIAQVEIELINSKFKSYKTVGDITLFISYKGIFRTFTIPYTILNNNASKIENQ